VLCAATFTASPSAAAISRAAHFDGHPVRAHVRFSNGAGDPTVPDATRDARGIAVKLYLPDGTTTDLIGITLPVFFTRTPEDLIEFNIARRPDPETGALDLAKVGAFLEQHPETVPAVTAAMTLPIPASYALLSYNALHTFKFLAADGTDDPRYHFVPSGEKRRSPTRRPRPVARATSVTSSSRAEERTRRLSSRARARGRLDPLDDPTACGQIASVCASATCRSPSSRSTASAMAMSSCSTRPGHRWHRAQRRSDPHAVGRLPRERRPSHQALSTRSPVHRLDDGQCTIRVPWLTSTKPARSTGC
jgi:catalase